jgi:hypothetical protein
MSDLNPDRQCRDLHKSNLPVTSQAGGERARAKRDATVMLPASVVDDTQKRTSRRGSHQTGRLAHEG